MTDLDFAKVIGRFGLNIGDTTADVDDNPDTIWCTEGRVVLTPLVDVIRVPGGSPPWTGGNAPIECGISQASDDEAPNYYADGDGYLIYAGNPFVYVVDLTSDLVVPSVTAGQATHRVLFNGLRAAGVRVDVPSFTCRLTAAGDGTSDDDANDLNLIIPIST